MVVRDLCFLEEHATRRAGFCYEQVTNSDSLRVPCVMPPQNFHGLPARPNLPPNPTTAAVHNPYPTPVVTTRTQPQAAPIPVSNLFANPYAQQPAPHYAQAYTQYYNSQNPAQSNINAQGYAYSSAYNPSASSSSSFPNQNQNQTQAVAGPSSGYGRNVGSGAGRGGRGTGQQQHHQQQQRPQHQQQTNWFTPGGARCKHPGCMFAGSAKAVEIHMMDRHLIYPPGWDKKKRKDEWDADPSLKGCVCVFLSVP